MIKKILRIVLIIVGFVAVVVAAAIYPFATRGHDLEHAILQRPYFLFGLCVVPVALFTGTLLQGWLRPHLKIGTVFPLARGPRGIRPHLRDLPGIVRAAALFFFVIALTRPINVKKDERAADKGIDIVLAMDLSGSMRAVFDGDASDLPGHPDVEEGKRLTRLDTAKVVVKDFVSRRKSDRIGVVVFAKHAYILSPPTLDYSLLSKLVSKLTLRVIDDSGTAIGDALSTSVARLRRSDAQSKVIILLTDGDSNAGEVSPDYAADLAAENHCKVYTIQIGNGDEVDVEEGSDFFGHPRYVRQRFPVNPELLQRIADKTDGKAFIANDGRALADSMHSILDQLEKTRFEAPRSSFEELFPFYLIPGVVLLGLDVLLRAFLMRRFP